QNKFCGGVRGDRRALQFLDSAHRLFRVTLFNGDRARYQEPAIARVLVTARISVCSYHGPRPVRIAKVDVLPSPWITRRIHLFGRSERVVAGLLISRNGIRSVGAIHQTAP